MRDLARAVTQFACEVTIYACERIIEALHAERPCHDDPLPEGHTDRLHPDDMCPDELWTPTSDAFVGGTYPKTITEWKARIFQPNPENN